MLEWLRLAFASPYSAPYGFITYLGAPVVLSVALAVILRRRDDVTWIAFFVSLGAYFTIQVILVGVHSTMSIGVMFAMIPFALVCFITVTAVRAIQSAIRRR